MHQWEIFMGYAAEHSGPDIGSHLRVGEVSGWAALVMSIFAGLEGAGTLLGAITPDVINSWFLLVGSLVLSGVASGALIYSKVIRTRLEGSTLTEIFAANNLAIRNRQPIPYPAFMPKGSITVVTQTTIDVTAVPKAPPEKEL